MTTIHITDHSDVDAVSTALSITADAAVCFGLQAATNAGCHQPGHHHDTDHAPGTLADTIEDVADDHVAMLVQMAARPEGYSGIGLLGVLHTAVTTWATLVRSVIPRPGVDGVRTELPFGWADGHGRVTLYAIHDLDGPHTDVEKGMIRVAGELYEAVVSRAERDTADPVSDEEWTDRIVSLLRDDVLSKVVYDGSEVVDVHDSTARLAGVLSVFTGAYVVAFRSQRPSHHP